MIPPVVASERQYVGDIMKEFSLANVDAVIIGSVVEKEKKFIIVR